MREGRWDDRVKVQEVQKLRPGWRDMMDSVKGF